MLSARRVRALWWLPILLVMSGCVVWLGDINWWDIPPLSPTMVTPVRMLHTLVGFGLLLLFGSVYGHGKQHWRRAKLSKRITGLLLWGWLAVMMVSALLLLYAPEDWHTLAVLSHALAGILMVMVGWVHVLLVNSRKKEKICG